MYTVYCDNCGFYEERNCMSSAKCPKCGNLLIVENDADNDGVADMINDDTNDLIPEEFKNKTYIPKEEHINDSRCIENMRQAIIKLGDKEVWDIIEEMPNAYHRIYYRNIFKKVGGKV